MKTLQTKNMNEYHANFPNLNRSICRSNEKKWSRMFTISNDLTETPDSAYGTAPAGIDPKK